MESLQLRSALSLPTSLTQEFPISPRSLSIQKQAFFRSSKFRCPGYRIGTVSVRARRGNGGEEEAEDSVSSLGFSKEEAETQRRRPLWQRAWGMGARKLGFGETWKEDPRGEQELEDLDSFLEGRGVGFRWKDVLEPSVENALALVLTGLFVYAVVLIGWQLVLVAAAITLSALKYAVIAAILLGVLIFFL